MYHLILYLYLTTSHMCYIMIHIMMLLWFGSYFDVARHQIIATLSDSWMILKTIYFYALIFALWQA